MNQKAEAIDLYADKNEPVTEYQYTVYKVMLPYSARMTMRTNIQPYAYIGVDAYGMISIESYTIWFGKHLKDLTWDERKEIYDWLVEWEIAEWKAIGPEDSELFITKPFAKAHNLELMR